MNEIQKVTHVQNIRYDAAEGALYIIDQGAQSVCGVPDPQADVSTLGHLLIMRLNAASEFGLPNLVRSHVHETV